MDIQVDEDVRRMIESEGRDYRVCTACMGPALVPTTVKGPKADDIRIPVGGNTLYVSRVQARYVTRVSMDMLYDREDIDSCPAFYPYNRYRSRLHAILLSSSTESFSKNSFWVPIVRTSHPSSAHSRA